MSTNQTTNPSYGTKVTDPNAPTKAEHSGAVAKDSLAADSLRNDGSFAAGNPTGISGAGGNNGTFNVAPGAGAAVTELRGGKADLPDDYSGLDKPDAAVKARAGATGTAGGGKQAQGAFLNDGDQRDVRPFENDEAGGARGSRHTGGSAGQGQQQSEGGVAARTAPLNTGTNPTADTFSYGGAAQGKVGDSAEDVDWSKVSKDTRTTTDIGSEDDPGRLAEDHFRKSATRQGQMAAPGERNQAGGKVGDENSFGALNSETGA